jgi:hypothetical protein
LSDLPGTAILRPILSANRLAGFAAPADSAGRNFVAGRRRGSKLPHLPCDSRRDVFQIETARDRKDWSGRKPALIA